MKSDENLEISVISTTDETVLDQSVVTETKRRRVTRCIRRCCRSFLPTKKQCNLAVTKFFVLLLLFGAVYGILNEGAVPGTEVFALLLLALLSYIGGRIFAFIRLPSLLGMLLAGYLYRNVSFNPFKHDISHRTASIIRDLSLVVILLSAGLGLDSQKLRRMKMVVIQLTCLPLLFETAAMTVFAHYLLDLPWIWGVMLGFVTSAVSVAVILPVLIRMRRHKLGTDKGIPTLILAACSMDDIIAITGFSVAFSILFSEGSITTILIRAPLEPLVGCAIGAVFGVIFWHLPSKEVSKASLVYYHTLLLCFGGISVMFVTVRVGIPGSGSLGCITLAFVAALRWRKDVELFAAIEGVVNTIWDIVEPFMFALIGAEMSIEHFHSDIGYSFLVIILTAACRLIVTPFIVFGSNLNLKEKIFVSCAWLAKATVQAAIGSRALDHAILNGKGEEFIRYGEQILTVSVLSIVVTAPLGAVLTSFLAPFLLNKEDSSASQSSVNNEEDEEESDTAVKSPPTVNYGSCHQLQPSDILPPKADA